MTETSMALDEAFERMGRLDFELPNGFVNHGPMACEALDALGFDEQIDGWARWFCQMVGEGPEAVAPRSLGGPGWQEGLGDYRRLPEWIGYFDRAIADDGWAPVVEQWVPRLMPGLGAALFHGVIRTAQAVRADDGDEDSAEWDGGFARTAAGHHDAHQVKLVEACQRGFKATGDRAFVAAAQRVTVGR